MVCRARSAAVGAVLLGACVVGGASASAATDPTPPQEAYPPTPSLAPDQPPATRPPEIPRTGNDGTDVWIKLGAGAVLAGGLMVTAASRRRHEGMAS